MPCRLNILTCALPALGLGSAAPGAGGCRGLHDQASGCYSFVRQAGRVGIEVIPSPDEYPAPFKPPPEKMWGLLMGGNSFSVPGLLLGAGLPTI